MSSILAAEIDGDVYPVLDEPVSESNLLPSDRFRGLVRCRSTSYGAPGRELGRRTHPWRLLSEERGGALPHYKFSGLAKSTKEKDETARDSEGQEPKEEAPVKKGCRRFDRLPDTRGARGVFLLTPITYCTDSGKSAKAKERAPRRGWGVNPP